ncbi:uncharacterized protein DUF5051 [Pontibacter ummariensis]|uniref:3'-5' exoribonuclease Rv2179c-like domain-containing protein n=1 Tax=Pontibacter ummariensis TaxID=1610492 RepID=A0A239HKL4_9BACT|nr:3'-5' exonuclease [Pontibacter ummariensis]PRY10299.1 uncharacterized protein DUF5051 [Pontibacter ummariensis]SNS81695.1 protein of unknown function [Pontibacter ummariensis]
MESIIDGSQLGHIMVDLETLSTGSNAAILSIGAVEFDLTTGRTGRTFYLNVDLQSCMDAGLKIDGRTVYWWFKREAEARLPLLENPVHIAAALQSFSEFVLTCGGKEAQLWGNSARFDLGKLDDAYSACTLPVPWSFRNERDVRTLVAFAPHIKDQEPRIGTHHHAVDDCYHQISYCVKTWRYLQSPL